MNIQFRVIVLQMFYCDFKSTDNVSHFQSIYNAADVIRQILSMILIYTEMTTNCWNVLDIIVVSSEILQKFIMIFFIFCLNFIFFFKNISNIFENNNLIDFRYTSMNFVLKHWMNWGGRDTAKKKMWSILLISTVWSEYLSSDRFHLNNLVRRNESSVSFCSILFVPLQCGKKSLVKVNILKYSYWI